MAWNPDEKGNPAWLTKQASEHGGVDNYIDDIRNEGYQEGHGKGVIEGVGIATVLIGIGIAAYNGIKHSIQKRKANRNSIHQKSESAKTALCQICENTADDTAAEEIPNYETKEDYIYENLHNERI